MKLENVLPKALYPYLNNHFEDGLEEIRIRVGQEAEFVYGDNSYVRTKRICEDDLTEMLNYLSDYSPYALEEELRQGFFTMQGGHRVGVAGRANRGAYGREDEVKKLVDIAALNIRVAHEVKDCAMPLYSCLWDAKGELLNMLILAAPGMGKTTVLRDLIRLLSTGNEHHSGVKVGVVDERSEIAACYCGIPQNDLGPRVDVLDNCPKAKGMQMLLRTMSPHVIAVDELGAKEEYDAVRRILYSGCKLIATIHANAACDLLRTPFVKELIADKKVERFVEIHRDKNGKRYYKVFDERFEALC